MTPSFGGHRSALHARCPGLFLKGKDAWHHFTFPQPKGGTVKGLCFIFWSRRRFGPCSWRKAFVHEYAICWYLHPVLFKRILINYSQGQFNMWPKTAPHDPSEISNPHVSKSRCSSRNRIAFSSDLKDWKRMRSEPRNLRSAGEPLRLRRLGLMDGVFQRWNMNMKVFEVFGIGWVRTQTHSYPGGSAMVTV